ncbi:MAG: DUF481 domain-containing protein [Planctomycetota bacterium]|nr:DUF481 domain-containing protein [Planctomycetota bacterium]
MRKKTFSFFGALWFSFLLFSSCAVQQKAINVNLSLNNGDSLKGELQNMVKGTLNLKHSVITNPQIKWSGVSTIETDCPTRIELKNGDIINGRFLPATPGKANIESEKSRATEVALDDILSINAPSLWKGNATVKASHIEGNTNSNDIGFKLSLARETLNDCISLKANYAYGETEGVLSKRAGNGKIKYDYSVSNVRFMYGFLMLPNMIISPISI